MATQETYTLDLKWSGKTEDPRNYDRSYTVSATGKPTITGSSNPSSRGDHAKWNPEEMLMASLASCHMLWYLYLCAAAKIVVTEYQDHPTGILTLDPAGISRFTAAALNPQVVITDATRIDEAIALQHKAHEKCFIVNSVNFEVTVDTKVTAKAL